MRGEADEKDMLKISSSLISTFAVASMKFLNIRKNLAVSYPFPILRRTAEQCACGNSRGEVEIDLERDCR